MKIEGSCVTFEPCDAAFVKKFGPLEAANMVLDYHSVHPNMPFLYDAEQLAGFFGINTIDLNSEGCPSWSPPSSHTLPYTVSAHFPMDHRIEVRLMAVFFFSGKSLPFFRRKAPNELPLRETNIFVFFLTRIGFVCSQNVKKDKCGVKFLFKLSIALRCGI